MLSSPSFQLAQTHCAWLLLYASLYLWNISQARKLCILPLWFVVCLASLPYLPPSGYFFLNIYQSTTMMMIPITMGFRINIFRSNPPPLLGSLMGLTIQPDSKNIDVKRDSNASFPFILTPLNYGVFFSVVVF